MTKNRVIRIIALFVLLCSVSCSNRMNQKQIVRKYYRKELKLNAPIRLVYNDTMIYENGHNNKKRIVIHIDSKQCQQCMINSFNMINEYVASLNSENINAIMICVVSKPETEIIKSIDEIQLQPNIIILCDETNSYLKQNKLEHYNTNYHSFLLDEKNRIVIVGDPLHNYSIRALYNRELTR